MGFGYSETDARRSSIKEASKKTAPVFGEIETDGKKQEVLIAKNGEITSEGERWLKEQEEKAKTEAAKKVETAAKKLPDVGLIGGSPHEKGLRKAAKGDTELAELLWDE